MSVQVPGDAPGEEEFDRTLRPQTLEDFVGQEQVKGQLALFIEAARRRVATPSQFKGLMATRIQFYHQSKEVRKSLANGNSSEPSEVVATSSEAVTEPSEQSQSLPNDSKGSSETKKAIADNLNTLVNHSGEDARRT